MLHAVTCLFNPCGYRRLVENHRRFAAALGAPLTTVELSFDGRFEIPDSLRIRGDAEKHALWQKERLLNLAIAALPPEADKVAWIDADLLFLNSSWAEEAERLLDDVAVCQLFERAHETDAAGCLTRSHTSYGAALASGRTPADGFHPGYAWAARRSLLAAGGLYDRNVVGGGDRAMAFAWLGRPTPDGPQRDAPGWWADYLAWARPQAEATGRRVGVVPGDVTHLYHGEPRNRDYGNRVARLTAHGYDPRTDLAKDGSGLWRWASDKPAMHRSVRDYFQTRNDDDGASRLAAARTPSDDNPSKLAQIVTRVTESPELGRTDLDR